MDKFSKQSEAYAKFRPHYPSSLFHEIFYACSCYNRAWDCATGNGQVAINLAEHFDRVIATDISSKQLDKAPKSPKIEYMVASAEHTTFPDEYFDLVTVGQALHWFDIPRFNLEVQRVLKPDGVFVYWGYGLIRVLPEIDYLIDTFYKNVIGPYWDPQRKYIDDEYQQLSFDFGIQKSLSGYAIREAWTISHFEGYLNSWSSIQNYKDKHQNDNPIPHFIKSIQPIWKDHLLDVSFPIFGKLIRNS